MINLTEEQKQKLKPVLESEVSIFCVQCDKVFLKTTARKFAIKFRKNKPSKEYLEAAAHWVETNHVILKKTHGVIDSLSGFWQGMAEARNLSKEEIKRQLEEASK